jgi:hypothetical protein
VSTSQPGEPPYGKGDQPPSRRELGCLVGGGVWGAFLVAFVVFYAADEARADEGGISAFWFLLCFAIPVAGYLFSIVATVRRSSRRFGQGMLLGLTLLVLVGFAVVFLIGFLTPT